MERCRVARLPLVVRRLGGHRVCRNLQARRSARWCRAWIRREGCRGSAGGRMDVQTRGFRRRVDGGASSHGHMMQGRQRRNGACGCSFRGKERRSRDGEQEEDPLLLYLCALENGRRRLVTSGSQTVSGIRSIKYEFVGPVHSKQLDDATD